MLDVIEQIGAFAGLAAFLGLAVLALLSFAQSRDIRRLREWAGSAPERDAERKEATSAIAAQRAEELRQLEEARTAERQAINSREERRRRREGGLPERSLFARLGERLGEPRSLVALFVVMVAVVGGGAYLLLSGGENGNGAQARKGANNDNSRPAAAKVNPGEVDVAVLNGTSVNGLAATLGDQIEGQGFSLGTVGNTPQSHESTVVMFERGNAPEAKRVANALGIRKVELMTAEVQGAAEGADVAVVAGEDGAAAAG